MPRQSTPLTKPVAAPPRRSIIPGVLMLLVFLALIGGLLLVSLFYAGAVIILGGVFLFVAMHYLVWGWWLGKIIHDEEHAGVINPHDRDLPDR